MTHYTHVRGFNFEFSLIGSCRLRTEYARVVGVHSLNSWSTFSSLTWPEKNTDRVPLRLLNNVNSSVVIRDNWDTHSKNTFLIQTNMLI